MQWKSSFDSSSLPTCLQKYGKDYEMTKIDKEKQIVTLKNGQQIEYGALITTTPLDLTLNWLGKSDIADRLEHRSISVPYMKDWKETLLQKVGGKWASCHSP